MNWVGAIFVGLGKRLVPWAIIAYFTTKRGEEHREADRRLWWKFAESARVSKGKADDAVAAYLKARFNYHDSPEEKAHKKFLENAGVDPENVSRLNGYHQL